MKKLFLKITMSLGLIAMLVLPVIAVGGTVVQAADAKTEICNGIGAAGGGAGCGTTAPSAAECKANPSQSGCEVNSVVQTIINIISWAAGVVAVIMVMLGGFWYITSNGDAAKATRGRTTILYAIVGLVIVALAQVIVRFVIGTVIK